MPSFVFIMLLDSCKNNIRVKQCAPKPFCFRTVVANLDIKCSNQPTAA